MTSAESPAEWRIGQECAPLADGALHVWLADLDRVGDQVLDHLRGSERERASRFTSERTRRRWMLGRGVLRSLLGRYLERDPRELRLGVRNRGKPFLLDDDQRPHTLRFNASHSGQFAMFAVSRGVEVGIDVEASRRPLDAPALAARLFGADEAARLGSLPPARAREEFLRAWVMREAQVKCLGTGLGTSLPASPVGMWTRELKPGAGAMAAVVAASPPVRLEPWLWAEARTGGSRP